MKELNKCVSKELPTITAHVCPYTEHICINCRYFDHSYHGGYCDRHKKDISSPTSSGCGDWWEKR